MPGSRHIGAKTPTRHSNLAAFSPDPAVCARCHREGGGCCRLGKGEAGWAFGLSQGEVEALAAASGLAPEQFVTPAPPGEDLPAWAESLAPALASSLVRGRPWRLRVDRGGACVFLGAGGCSLPRSARPLFCRLYPFLFGAGGGLLVVAGPECLAWRQAQGRPQVLMRRLGTTRAELRALYQRLVSLAG